MQKQQKKRVDWLLLGALLILVVEIPFVFFTFFQPAGAPALNAVDAPPPDVFVDAYDRGRVSGHNAAMKQFGVPGMMLADTHDRRAYQYTSGPADASESDDDEARGYADGYHRALDIIFCPAVGYGAR